MVKAFDPIWIDGLLYKLTLLNFPSYTVHTISSYLRDRTFEASFQTATSSRRGMRAGVPQGGLISPVLFSLYVNDMHRQSHHIELTFYADDTATTITRNIRASNCSTKTSVNNQNNISFSLKNVFQTSFPSIKYHYTSTKKIENIIKSLNSSNSCGYDEVLMKLLKLCSY